MNTSKISKEELLDIAKRIPRFNFNGFIYLSLAIEAFKKYKNTQAKLSSISDKVKRYNEKYRFKQKMKKNHIIVIIFATMFLESAIWDYVASKKSDDYAKKLFKKNRMGHKDKWLKIPKILCDKEIPKDSIAILLLHKLVDARNDIIHSKTQPPPKDFNELKSRIQKEDMLLTISVDEAIQCIAECINELQRIDNKWWLFNVLTGNALIGKILLPGFKVINK